MFKVWEAKLARVLRRACTATGEIEAWETVDGNDAELKWNGELDPGKWAQPLQCLICMVTPSDYFHINPYHVSVTYLAVRIHKKRVKENLLYVGIDLTTSLMCASFCIRYMWRAVVCVSGVGRGESSAGWRQRLRVSERRTSLSHGLSALCGLASHLVIGWFLDRDQTTKSQTQKRKRTVKERGEIAE